MVEAADRLALGDVEVDVKAETRDELGNWPNLQENDRKYP